ncbi:unnamed protein product [Acanthosepion pharaonis]|uniref:Uncharacterized protein n=1 Tax=Acanthosepion pharaonis TaxID=158019 RepID=A0A812AUT7_ACAPH|nr:unnamed protein product [Sepia pharaonis]
MAFQDFDVKHFFLSFFLSLSLFFSFFLSFFLAESNFLSESPLGRSVPFLSTDPVRHFFVCLPKPLFHRDLSNAFSSLPVLRHIFHGGKDNVSSFEISLGGILNQLGRHSNARAPTYMSVHSRSILISLSLSLSLYFSISFSLFLSLFFLSLILSLSLSHSLSHSLSLYISS